MSRPDMAPMWTVSELSSHWQVGQSTLRKWICDGRLHPVNLAEVGATNRCLRITDEERIRFENANQKGDQI